jgi:cation:H+ antiporter
MKLLACLLSGTGKAIHAAWTAPAVLLSAFLIAWGAEAAQFMISQGLALAILAWLQTLPEFAVEADIAWGAARGTNPVSDVTANFTGSIQLIMGFGMPVAYFIFTRFWSRARHLRPIVLDPFHSVEIISLFPPIIYVIYIFHKGTLDLVDSVVLAAFYVIYLGLLLKMPPEEEEDLEELPRVSQWILRRGRLGRVVGVTLTFVLGGAILYLCVHAFLESLRALAIMLGVQSYVFIKWVAPFMSEMPEKVSAFNWARQDKRASMALMNFLSSNINQLTVLVAMVPLVFAISCWTGNVSPPGGRAGDVGPTIHFDEEQRMEVLLTTAQAALCLVLLLNLKFEWWDAVGMFVLWVIQFLSPLWTRAIGMLNEQARSWIVLAYCGWIALEVILCVTRVRRWQFPMLARPSPVIFKQRTSGP